MAKIIGGVGDLSDFKGNFKGICARSSTVISNIVE
jgi:hypothetical protein